MIDLSRRKLLRAALFVAAAPIIVRASSLMHVRSIAGNVPMSIPYAFPDDDEGLEMPLAVIRSEGNVVSFDPWLDDAGRLRI